MPVMLEGVYGPREILPASLWPGLTVGGAAIRSWQHAEQRAVSNDHQVSAGGIWLPSVESSGRDLDALGIRAAKHTIHGELQDVMAGVAISATGCWPYVGENQAQMVHDMASLDVGATILEPLDRTSQLRQCDDSLCVYHRHYDLSFGVPSGRRELVYPNLDYFRVAANDEIVTAWGDRLPSAAASRAALADFQRQCLPYAERGQSPLTAGGISQIVFLPETGCWFVRSYYMTPIGVDGYNNWQYDGYGRLRMSNEYARAHKRRYGYPSRAMLAHRIVWSAMGNRMRRDSVLNHMCGFRPCANPGHIEQVSPTRNIIHGKQMAYAGMIVEGGSKPHTYLPAIKGLMASRAQRQNLDEFYT